MKTKELLADSFRSLVLTMPFQKISIKMITDGAHVIRPTFYNYFQDKYEVIEFLFDQDIGSKVEVMIENDMEQEAIKLMFICFEKNKEYYHRLFETTGQNCFGEFFSHYCEQTFFRILSRHPMRKMPCELITPQSLAHYNALLLIEILKLWLSSPKEVPAERRLPLSSISTLGQPWASEGQIWDVFPPAWSAVSVSWGWEPSLLPGKIRSED